MDVSKSSESIDEKKILKPILSTGKWFYISIAILFSLAAFAVWTWYHQINTGLGVTGMNRPVFWGIYITNFVFFIGISHAGTLISAILRICQAEWRRSITRAAEVITVLVLFFGVFNIIVDLGRPDRALNVIKHAQFRSPLLWDVTSISLYLTASSFYLLLPLIPDIARLRDRQTGLHWLYRILSFGWKGTPRQERILEKAIAVTAILVIPIAVSVHTVVSWVFGMTVQPMWHSTIFGPYFVVGAIYSGIAALLITMAIIRKVYHFENYMKEIHFANMGKLLVVFTLLWFYFTFTEYLTTFYGSEPTHMAVFYSKLSGPFAPLFWGMVLCCFVIPLAVLSRKKTRTVTGCVISSVAILIGMWLERFTIVVPTLINPRLPYAPGQYSPTWVEWSITAGCFAFFILLYMAFTKIFPIISIWEVEEGRRLSVSETSERVKTYLPD
jgi:molybdopterin-containing oxidoreductase family membrane subunit